MTSMSLLERIKDNIERLLNYPILGGLPFHYEKTNNEKEAIVFRGLFVKKLL